MLIIIRSVYFKKLFFSYIDEVIKLKIIKYNKNLQNDLDINIINYKFFKEKYIIYVSDGKGKEYNDNNDTLIRENIKMEKEMEKAKNIMMKAI